MKIVKSISAVGVILVAVSITLAHAEKVPAIFTGNGLEVAYNEHGLWNDTTIGQGLEYNGIPISYPGIPWQQVSIAYNNIVQGQGNFSFYDWNLQVPVVGHTGGSGFGDIGSTTVWNAGDLRIMKEESWLEEGKVMKIDVTVTNECCEDVKDFIFMHAVDSDQDQTFNGAYSTLNGALPMQSFAFSAGLYSGLTTSYGVCDRNKQDVGHTRWDSSPFAPFSTVLSLADDTMHIRHHEPLINGW